jgi:hypothetical protein
MLYDYTYGGDMDATHAFPDGERSLMTKNGSEIMVTVKNGVVTEFKAIDFKKEKEKLVAEDDYCAKGYFYGQMYFLYGNDSYDNLANNIKLKNLEGEIKTLNGGGGFYVYKEDNKYIVMENYGEETFVGPIFGQVDFVFNEYGRFLTGRPNESPYKEVIMKVDNCMLIYYNKDYISFK